MTNNKNTSDTRYINTTRYEKQLKNTTNPYT